MKQNRKWVNTYCYQHFYHHCHSIIATIITIFNTIIMFIITTIPSLTDHFTSLNISYQPAFLVIELDIKVHKSVPITAIVTQNHLLYIFIEVKILHVIYANSQREDIS
jgi:hypothetical protein